MADWIESVFSEFWNVVGGIIGAIIALIYPIIDILSFLVIVFIIDCIIGIFEAKCISREKFTTKKIWNGTVLRMVFSLIVISLLFRLECIYGIGFAGLHKIAGGFFTGVIIISILHNMYKITKWKAILTIVETIKKKMKIKNNTIE